MTNLANHDSFESMHLGMEHSYSIGEAKTQLSKLVALAEQGKTVELRRDKTPVARLVPVPPAGALRTPGALRGGITMASDFDVWPDDIAHALGLHG